MTTSTSSPDRAVVWIWLPGSITPVPAGLIRRRGRRYDFTYGRRYLDRADAISLYQPELPLRPGPIEPIGQLEIASVLRDAGPDSWGQRIILAQTLGVVGADADPGEVDQLTYFLRSGSDRISALDFQLSAQEYTARGGEATLDEMMAAAEQVETGVPLSPALDTALMHGTSVGGARPKATLTDGGRGLLAKFTSSTDVFPTVKAEAVGLELARRVGIRAPSSELVSVMGRDVLLVERFDRTSDGARRLVVSGLTMLGLAEHEARYATYPELLDVLAGIGDDSLVGRELFQRIVFNVAIGNNDDHARNHAAFWDGRILSLTPAYDLTPQVRSGETSAQAMSIDRSGQRDSSFATCLRSAGVYGLSGNQARDIIDGQIQAIESGWSDASEHARLTVAERKLLHHRSILNPSTRYGFSVATNWPRTDAHVPSAGNVRGKTTTASNSGSFRSRVHAESNVQLEGPT